MASDERTAGEAQRILDDAARYAGQVPALEALFAGFGPVLAEQARLRAEAPGWKGDLPAVDSERFCQGVFLLADAGFQDVSPELPAAAVRLLPVMEQAFPALAGELAALGKALAEGSLEPEMVTRAAFSETPLHVPGVSGETLRFAAAELVRPFIERQARDLLPLVAELPWRRGMCPICGGAPNFSLLRKVREESEFIQAHGGQRLMHCSVCSTQWRCKRVSCPACGNEEPDELFNLRVEGRPFERADICKKCKTFVLCLDTVEFVDIPDLDVAALAMLPLELRVRKEGYAPLAGHPWSPGI